MRKVVVHRPGGLEQLRIEPGPDREPGPQEVAIAVSAIGVNYADCVVRMGLYESAKQYVIYGFHTMLPRKPRGPDWVRLAVHYLRTPRWTPLDMTNQNRSVLAFNLSYLFAERGILTEAMGELLGAWRAGRLQLPRTTPYSFDRVADAHRDLQSGQTVGKLILLP